jgi:cytoskeletal protein CcmA (bactofilin family)
MSYRVVDSTCVSDISQSKPVAADSSPSQIDRTSLLFDHWAKDVRPFLENGCSCVEVSDQPNQSEFTFEGTLRIEGHVQGALRSGHGKLIVGKQGRCEADADVGAVLIEGNFNGSIHASESIEVTGEARVTGEIEAPIVSIGHNAVFEGECHILPGCADSSHSISLVHDSEIDLPAIAAAS